MNQAHRSPRLYANTVITTPNRPIPIEATPIALKNDWLLEPGHMVMISPKTRIATPIIVSKTHAILKGRFLRIIFVRILLSF
jgi:hypothetical protein